MKLRIPDRIQSGVTSCSSLLLWLLILLAANVARVVDSSFMHLDQYGFSYTTVAGFCLVNFLVLSVLYRFNILDGACLRLSGFSFFSACLVLFLYRLFQFDILFIDNHHVFWFYGVPLLLMLISGVFWLPARGLRLSLSTFLIVLLLSEVFFWVYGKESHPLDMCRHHWIPLNDSSATLSYQSRITGYHARPGAAGIDKLVCNGDTVNQALYEIDSYSRRIIPCGRGNESKFLLFFGGSFTFGVNVEGDETLPYYLCRLMDGYRPFVYAFGGWGPAQFLAILDNRDIRLELPMDTGIVVYVMIDDHINRTVGSYRVSTTYNGGTIPYYVKEENGQFIRKGMFIPARPVLQLLYSMLSYSHTWNYFVADMPVSEKDVYFTGEMVVYIKNRLEKLKHLEQFIVVILPAQQKVRTLTPLFHQSGITVVDLSGDTTLEKYYQPRYEMHFSPQGYRLLSGRVFEVIRQDGD